MRHRAAARHPAAGTANDLARTLGIPEDCGEAARIVVAGHTRRIDMGLVNEPPVLQRRLDRPLASSSRGG